jgi:hypothetical protein
MSWCSESHQSHQKIRISRNLIKKKAVLIRILTRLRPIATQHLPAIFTVIDSGKQTFEKEQADDADFKKAMAR